MVEASGGRCSPKAAGILRARGWGSPAVTREGASGFGRGRDGGGEGRGRGASRNQVQGAGSWRCLEESASLSARSVCSTGSDVATGTAHGLQPSSAPCPWLTTVQAPCLPPFCRPCCPSTCVSLSVNASEHAHLCFPAVLLLQPLTWFPSCPTSPGPPCAPFKAPHFPQAVYQPCWAACRPVGSSELLWNFALGSQWCPPWRKPSVTQERG